MKLQAHLTKGAHEADAKPRKAKKISISLCSSLPKQ